MSALHAGACSRTWRRRPSRYAVGAPLPTPRAPLHPPPRPPMQPPERHHLQLVHHLWRRGHRAGGRLARKVQGAVPAHAAGGAGGARAGAGLCARVPHRARPLGWVVGGCLGGWVRCWVAWLGRGGGVVVAAPPPPPHPFFFFLVLSLRVCFVFFVGFVVFLFFFFFVFWGGGVGGGRPPPPPAAAVHPPSRPAPVAQRPSTAPSQNPFVFILPGLVKDVVELFPNVTVVASKVALAFLQNLTHVPLAQRAVKGGDKVRGWVGGWGRGRGGGGGVMGGRERAGRASALRSPACWPGQPDAHAHPPPHTHTDRPGGWPRD